MGRYDSNIDQLQNQLLSSIQAAVLSVAAANKPVISMPAPLQGMAHFGGGNYIVTASPGAYNYIVPLGVTSIRVRVVGGGGGGAGLYAGQEQGLHAQGGGGGGFAIKVLSGLTSGLVLPYTVGAGGYGGYECAASNGGDSVFDTTIIGGGGKAGKHINAGQGVSSAGTGVGGVASGGDINFAGGNAGSVPSVGSYGYNNYNTATGGGAAGSIKGGGYSGGNLLDSGATSFATGGGGVGGNAYSPNTVEVTGKSAGPGGGSMGAAFALKEKTIYNRHPGTGIYTYSQETELIAGGFLPQWRFPGDFLIGSGGLANSKSEAVDETGITADMLNGGSGAGGGGVYDTTANNTALTVIAGNGGFFGGGGGALVYRGPSGSSAKGGLSLLGGGGGGACVAYAAGTAEALGGHGGHGMVIIEW